MSSLRAGDAQKYPESQPEIKPVVKMEALDEKTKDSAQGETGQDPETGTTGEAEVPTTGEPGPQALTIHEINLEAQIQQRMKKVKSREASTSGYRKLFQRAWF